jgi:hypothetical protein
MNINAIQSKKITVAGSAPSFLLLPAGEGSSVLDDGRRRYMADQHL